MAAFPNREVGRIQQLLGSARSATASDGQLVARLVEERDPVAFETLVHRHGPLVLGVCRRVLKNTHDAEDAFQATFLILVRKAGSLLSRSTVGEWLYGVAHNTALKARSTEIRRREKERQTSERPHEDTTAEEVWQEWLPRLDQELSRLPTNFRIPIVLCDLEGKTRKEAAQQLGWPEGTVAGRLARAREMLAQRMSRHGVSLTSVAVAATLAQQGALPTVLIAATVESATLWATGQAVRGMISANVAALTEGVLQAMWMTKLKMATTVLLLCGFIGLGAGGLVTAQRPPEPEKKSVRDPFEVEPAQDAPKRAKADAELEKAKAALERAKAEYQRVLRNRALREIEEALNELKQGPPNPQKDEKLVSRIKKAADSILSPSESPVYEQPSPTAPPPP